MKAESKLDWSVLQGAVITFMTSIAISAALIGTTWYYKDKMQREYQLQKARFQSISNQYLAVDQEEKLIRDYYPKFVELYNKGILGQERRLNWIETLHNAEEQIKLPGLTYEIQSQTKYIPDFSLNAGNFQIYNSPMKLNMNLLHEGDLKKLLDALNSQAPGIYNVSNCKLRRSGQINLDDAGKGNISAECELRWFNIKKSDGTEIKLSS
jgi:hypothetical protein